MPYNVKITYPVQAELGEHKIVTTKQTEDLVGISQDDVVKLYNDFKRQNYNVNAAFTVPKQDENGSDVDYDPFALGEDLTKQGIDYKANLKLKAKGSYQDLLPIMNLIESEGFDMTVGVKLKINEKTSLNVNEPTSWADEDAVFDIKPKASSVEVNELKSLYDDLIDRGFDATIELKPKKTKDEDEDQEDESFAKQLASYPDGTLVKFTLADGE